MTAFALNLTPATIEANQDPVPYLLSPAELSALNARIAANADALIAARVKPKEKKVVTPRGAGNGSRRGRPKKSVLNPFYTYIGPMTDWGRYPGFAMDAVAGISRLDWYGERSDSAEKYMPLSQRSIMVILETLSFINTDAVGELLGLGDRHAQRYVKACELAIPYMMGERPARLVAQMEGIEPEYQFGNHQWEDIDYTPPPAAELAKLHHDLRDLGEDSQLTTHVYNSNSLVLRTACNDSTWLDTLKEIYIRCSATQVAA